jgi:hypothetical protein
MLSHDGERILDLLQAKLCLSPAPDVRDIVRFRAERVAALISEAVQLPIADDQIDSLVRGVHPHSVLGPGADRIDDHPGGLDPLGPHLAKLQEAVFDVADIDLLGDGRGVRLSLRSRAFLGSSPNSASKRPICLRVIRAALCSRDSLLASGVGSARSGSWAATKPITYAVHARCSCAEGDRRGVGSEDEPENPGSCSALQREGAPL